MAMAIIDHNENPGDMSLSWDYCPTDILLKVFELIPMQSLAVCTFVSRSWRSNVEYYLKHKNKWEEFLNKMLNCNGNQLKARTESCDWGEIYNKYTLWHSILSASSDLQMVHNDKFRNIHIREGHLLVITDSNVQFYELESLTKIAAWDIVCQDVCMMKHCNIVVTETDTFYEFNIYKKSGTDLSMDVRRDFLYSITNIIHYSIFDDHCCFIDEHHATYVYSYDVLQPSFRARFYGTMWRNMLTSLLMLDKQIFFSTKDGLIWWVDPTKRNFRKIVPITELPSDIDSREIFYWYWLDTGEDAWMGFDVEARKRDERLQIYSRAWHNEFNESIVIIRHLSNISYVLEHGNIIILGYPNGMVEIRSGGSLLTTTALFRFNLKDLYEYTEDLAIIDIKVYDDDIKHLIIATRTNLYHVRFRFDNLETLSDQWTDKAYSFLLRH